MFFLFFYAQRRCRGNMALEWRIVSTRVVEKVILLLDCIDVVF